MDNIKYEINGYYELLNLHKALLEAKFHQNPDNKYIAGSPYISEICNDVVDLLQAYDCVQKGEDVWKEWRKISNQDYYKRCVIDKIIDFGEWSGLEKDYKKKMLLNYLSPFQCSETELDDLIKTIDELTEKR